MRKLAIFALSFMQLFVLILFNLLLFAIYYAKITFVDNDKIKLF
jgi:hypothetical protein